MPVFSRGSVHRELYGWEVLGPPVGPSVCSFCSDSIVNGAVRAFHLTVSLRVIGGGPHHGAAQNGFELVPHMPHELSPSVAQDAYGGPIVGDHSFHQQSSNHVCSVVRAGYHDVEAREGILEHHDKPLVFHHQKGPHYIQV